ncbi:MAG: thiamine phosphate synthase [Anaerovoracaceae bacterium]
MNISEKDLLLYAVTDRKWTGPKTLEEQVEEALKGGATFVQIREKHLDYEAFRQEALALQALCRRYQVPFVVNDNVQLALEIGADGVHVGQDDMEAGAVREKLGPDKILGVSAQTVEQALRAQERGADYLGVGAVFPTSSKDDASEVSFETLKAICQAVSIPVVAIGGITRENLRSLAGSGMAGIAVISALFGQENIAEAAAALKKITGEIL